MDAPQITDWMSGVGTIFAALVAAPAAVYAAIYTKRAAEAGARAAAEAANQVRELQAQREPRATLKLRVPEPFNYNQYIQYGRGNDSYRSGPPVYLDVWNVSGPTLMVMEVTVRVKERPEGKVRFGPLTPQLIVESGKVASVNVAYQLMGPITPASEEFINFPDGTTAEAIFKVQYFSTGGDHFVETDCQFQFRVTEKNIITWVVDLPKS